MDWLILGYAILITFGILGGVIGFIYLMAKYEDAYLVLICILLSLAVYAVYLLLKAGG